MNALQIHSTFKNASRFLVSKQMKNALDETQLLVDELQNGLFADRLDDLRQNYRFLLQYYANGVEDPQRKSVYRKLEAKLFLLNSELREELLVNNSSNYEYTQKRYLPYQNTGSLAEIYKFFTYFHSQNELLAEDSELHQNEIGQLQKQYESKLPALFSILWLKTSYTAEEKEIIKQLISSATYGRLEKGLAISALTLNVWRMFDESKLTLLFDACDETDPMIRQRAIVGLSFVLAKYNQYLPFFPAVRNRLVLMADNTHTVENFQNILFQIIGSTETENITKKMQEEILPEISKIAPKLRDKADIENLLNTEDLDEENPEWQKLLDESGVSDKLQELSELQMSGADVYMSTFSMLKMFPFFQNVSNWFLPFDVHHSAVKNLFGNDKASVLNAFMTSAVMCNSDKYSFCLSVAQMPEMQKNMMLQSFSMEVGQMEELEKDEALLNPDKRAANFSKQYIQDLYRFFKLFPDRKDFTDMFSTALLMHKTYLFDILTANSDIKTNIANFYFSKGLYAQATELFEELVLEQEPKAENFQKLGFSYQKNLNTEKALETYKKADMIQPDDLWTVKKIALCHRLLGQFEKALENYLHIDYLAPNKQATLLNIARCYIELEKYKEAQKIYNELENEDTANPKLWRAITWCAFVSGNTAQAAYYSSKTLETQATAIDYLHAGHIAWCQRKIAETVEYYKQSWTLYGQDKNAIAEIINSDKKYLLANGIDADEIPFLLDAFYYKLDN